MSGCLDDPGCNLCCKLIGVQEIDKPNYRMCPHACKGGGCGIYEKRPEDCATFQCLWLASQHTDVQLPVSLKPSRCGAVLLPAASGDALVVHLNDGVNWRRGALGRFIKHYSYESKIIIRHRYTLLVVFENMIIGEDREFGVGQEGEEIVNFTIGELPLLAQRVAVP